MFAFPNFTYCNINKKNKPTISVTKFPGGYTKTFALNIYRTISKRKNIATYILSKYIIICNAKEAFETRKSIVKKIKIMLLDYLLLFGLAKFI